MKIAQPDSCITEECAEFLKTKARYFGRKLKKKHSGKLQTNYADKQGNDWTNYHRFWHELFDRWSQVRISRTDNSGSAAKQIKPIPVYGNHAWAAPASSTALANTASVLPATWMELKRITLKIKYVMLKKFATQHSIKFIVLLSFCNHSFFLRYRLRTNWWWKKPAKCSMRNGSITQPRQCAERAEFKAVIKPPKKEEVELGLTFFWSLLLDLLMVFLIIRTIYYPQLIP